MIITSVKNEKIKQLIKLKQKKYRDETQTFLIEGYHLVEEALKMNCVSLLIKSEDCFDSIDFKDKLIVSTAIIEKLSFSKKPQPVMALCHYLDFDIDYSLAQKILILDDVQDPGNVGTLIRTALAFNYDGILISNKNADIYNDKVIRSTQGAIFKIPIIKTNLIKEINLLKEFNFNIIGTSLNKSILLDELKLNNTQKLVVILGNEGSGISQEVLKKVDISIKIPISKQVESLNVAVAGAIVLYHLNK
jgi:rRNA methylases